jgi:hypothetical protein
MLTVPWCTYAFKEFNLNNIGVTHGLLSRKINKDDVLFVSKATCDDAPGHLVFNLIKEVYCFWPRGGGNIQEYLRLKEKSFSWEADIDLLGDKIEEFTLKVGSKG